MWGVRLTGPCRVETKGRRNQRDNCVALDAGQSPGHRRGTYSVARAFRGTNSTHPVPRFNCQMGSRTTRNRTSWWKSVRPGTSGSSTFAAAAVDPSAPYPACMSDGFMHTADMRYALGTSVGERGQITIERDIRERLGIKPRDIAIQRVEEGRLVVEFVRPHEPHSRSLVGILGPSSFQPVRSTDIDGAVSEGIAEEWRSYLEREADEGPKRAARRNRPRGSS
jgi:bifunctional DNA-binding transcriptional regulator/antitoxin component of YhaV-PrlF toxin-antitoxin module